MEWSGDKDPVVHVNLTLARAGLARVIAPKNLTEPVNMKLLSKLEEEQEQARKEKLYMWKYGNIYEDN